MTPDQTNPIKFLVDLGAAGGWQSVQRRIAVRIIMAYVVAAPRLGTHRLAIALKLLDGDHDALRVESVDKPLRRLTSKLRRAIKLRANLIRDYESPRSQRKRLHFDPGAPHRPKAKKAPEQLKAKKAGKKKAQKKKLYGSHSKAVLITGILVLTFDWAERLGHPLLLSEAKEFLESRGDEAFWGNQINFYKSGINDAWKGKRDVAHICAALAVLLDQHSLASNDLSNPWRRFSAVEEEILIERATHFLACAMWFEGVLQRVLERAHATMKLDLRRLPEWLEIDPLQNAGVEEVPERFRKAFDLWIEQKG